jgi:hypothetical protein
MSKTRVRASFARAFDVLESRTLLSATLFVTGSGVPMDGSHFQSLSSALAWAQVGDTIHVVSGYVKGAMEPSSLVFDKALTLVADAGVALPFTIEVGSGVSGVTMSGVSGATLVFDAGSFGNSVSDSVLSQVTLKGGSHNNTFTHDSISGLTALGGDDASGHDLFQNGTFTGAVTINGNATTATGDTFANNTFAVSNGDALTLNGASGTTVQGNIVADSSPFGSGIVVHNAADVLVVNNTVTTSGMNGTGIYIYTDGNGTTSVDVRGNSAKTGNGSGIYIAKYDTTASMELRVQGNDLRGNNVGAFVFGDGATIGTVDFGGGTTKFGAGGGQNDFSSYTSADGTHYAIGMFATGPGEVLVADNNYFGVASPLTVVADGTHDAAAFGTGVVLGTQYVAPTVTETITAATSSLSGIETGAVSGIVAHFSSNVGHVAGDFAVTIAWGDGSTSAGIVVANAGGGFDVMASHTWGEVGSYTFTASISDANASVNVQGSAAIGARVIGVLGNNITSVLKQTFNGVVATFTDNLPGKADSYTASVAWSDGVTTAATIVRNGDGSFSIKASRAFTRAGVVLASVSIGTKDGLFFGTTSLTATITSPGDNGKCDGREVKCFRQLVSYLCHHVQTHSYSHGMPAFAVGHCRR